MDMRAPTPGSGFRRTGAIINQQFNHGQYSQTDSLGNLRASYIPYILCIADAIGQVFQGV